MATAPPPSTYIPTYTWTDLGTLPGYTGSSAFALNDAGEVAGDSYDAMANESAFRYSGSMLSDLGVLNLGESSVGFGINSSGVVAGMSFVVSVSHFAVTWSGTTITDISGGIDSWANDVNDGGDVVGTMGALGKAFVYHGASLTDLNTLVMGGDPMTLNVARSINNGGDIVGSATTASGLRGFLFHAGTVTNLGVLGGTSANSYADDVNELGHVLVDNTGSINHAFLWDGSRHDLGTLPGYPYTAGFGLNDSDWAVGTMSAGQGNEHAFVWVAGRLVDLNTRVKLPAGWVVQRAFDINNVGQIITQVTGGGHVRAVLLTPSNVTRTFGSSRYDTAAKISHDNYTADQPLAFVATGLNFPDALAGAALAGREGAPLLLVPATGTLPATVATELGRLNPTSIVILGGTGAVSDAMELQLAYI